MSSPVMLAFEHWPAVDRAAWDRLFVDGGLFETSGRGRGWAAATVRKLRYSPRRWLGFLSVTQPDALLRDPHGRFSGELISECLIALASEGLKPGGIASFLDGLVQLHAAFDPERTPQWLRRLARTHMCEARAATERADYRISVGTIWHGVLSALRVLENKETTPDLASAIAYRDHLILALFVFTLLRRENLARLDLQMNLTWTEDGWLVWVDASAVKNRKEFVRLLPTALGRCLEIYLTRFRPILLGGRCSDNLWINFAGGPLNPNTVPLRSKELLGLCSASRSGRMICVASRRPPSPRMRRSRSFWRRSFSDTAPAS
jgi:hypothetical protein